MFKNLFTPAYSDKPPSASSATLAKSPKANSRSLPPQDPYRQPQPQPQPHTQPHSPEDPKSKKQFKEMLVENTLKEKEKTELTLKELKQKLTEEESKKLYEDLCLGIFNKYQVFIKPQLDIHPLSRLKEYECSIVLPTKRNEVIFADPSTLPTFSYLELSFQFKESGLFGEIQKDAFLFEAVECVLNYFKNKKIIENEPTLIDTQDILLAAYQGMILSYKQCDFGSILEDATPTMGLEGNTAPMGKAVQIDLEKTKFNLIIQCPKDKEIKEYRELLTLELNKLSIPKKAELTMNEVIAIKHDFF